ncbi:MAG: hypothetical protein NVSMB30_26490 [Hymenobacter sp.]
MENEELNLNTEPNDIAGNRKDGPVGNTAAQPGLPGTGTGMPGGPPAQAGVGPGGRSPAATGQEVSPPEMQGVDSADLASTDTYGGNFSNSTQDSYRDQNRRDNQDSDPNRGEFGAQDLGGTTHGGFGNQNRLADYEPHGSAEDRYYGGPGRPGHQDNAYRAYDGRDERPDARSEYGFESGPAADSTARAGEPGRVGGQKFEGLDGDNCNRPDRASPTSAQQNDNGSGLGPDHGYASDYGHTSLRAADPAAGATPPESPSRRNQAEDYLPSQSGFDHQGRREEQHPGYSTNDPEVADQRGQHPASSQGYGDREREEPRRAPDFQTGDERNGYVGANGGDSAQGIGSRGGSYNDAYDDSRPGSNAGSPAQGDQRRADTDSNYGSAARQQNRAADENEADHDAPRRNAGRDGEADE